MGWGWRYGGYRSRGWGQPGKKAQAASLSTATLQRIIAQQKAEEEATARYHIQAAQARRAAEERAAEEARLELEHGGKEALALWRVQNAERLQAERQAKMEADRAAAAEKAIVDSMAELRAELALLPRGVGTTGSSAFQINKAQVKTHFHLTDRELEALPKTVIQKEGAKKPSKILWASADIFGAVTRKEGKRKLRIYQAAYNPSLARRFIEDELCVLETKHPSHVEKSRVSAIVTLRAADDAAIAAAKAAEQQVEAAYKALELAREKQRKARTALAHVATADEMEGMGLADIPNDDDDDDEEHEEEEEEEAAADDGYRSTHTKRAHTSRTPVTAPAGGSSSKAAGKKKQRVAEQPERPLSTSRPSRNLKAVDYAGMDENTSAGPSSAGGPLLVD